MARQAAQNQHYVPKFILRKFLANKGKERVNVFQKSTGKEFQTSIANAMAERRFNEFLIDEDYYASFEDIACRVEDAVLPVYEALVKKQQLTGSSEENAMLGVFFAFQMLRTRAYRDNIKNILQQFHGKFEGMGFEGAEIDEMGAQTESDVARNHLQFLRHSIEDFSATIGEKYFVLLQAPKDRSFYLSDNPVTLHNDEKWNGFGGNIGLSVKGIQIHVPLTSRFMLAAFCPSILKSYKADFEDKSAMMCRLQANATLSAVPLVSQRKQEFDVEMDGLKVGLAKIENFISATSAGTPLIATPEDMDFYNSMQVANAREFIVCERGDFDLAQRYVKKHGATGGGWRMKVG